MTRRLPACAYLWPVGPNDRVGETHGGSHRCIENVGHVIGFHYCACGAELDSVTPRAHDSDRAV